MDAESDTDIKGKVLVVDDEKIICHTIRIGLQGHNYQVVTAQSAEEALEKIKNEAFDVVLADIRMPEMDGIQMLKAIREIDLRLPVIFITGYPSVETSAEALELGAEAYISKPFHRVENILVPIESAIARVKQRKEGKSVIEAKEEEIECLDCYFEFSMNNWQPGYICPKCGSEDTFPLPATSNGDALDQGVADALDSLRFGRIARWADLVNSSELVECLTIQWELIKAGKPVPLLGEVMLKKGYLNSREVSAILKAQSINRPAEEEKSFGTIALHNEFITTDQLETCLSIQTRAMCYQGKAPHLGEILLERGYVTESQVKKILRFLKEKEEKGLLQYVWIESIPPTGRFKRRLAAFWKRYRLVRVCSSALCLLMLLLGYFAVTSAGRPLFPSTMTVIDDSGTIHRVASTGLSTLPKKSNGKLSYALYCKKCGVYFPLRIDSEPGGNFTLQPCPRCAKLEHVDIPASVRKVIGK